MSKRFLLQKLGLSQREISVYLYLLDNGTSSVSDIARGTSLSRTNVYNHIGALRKQSLVSTGYIRRKKVITPENPHNLIDAAQSKVEYAQEVAAVLSGDFLKNHHELDIKVYHDREGFRLLLKEVYTQGTEEVYQITSLGNLCNVLKSSYVQKINTTRINNDIYVKQLMPFVDRPAVAKQLTEIDAIKQLKEIRFLPDGLAYQASIIIGKDAVYISNPLSCRTITRLRDCELAQNFLSLFNGLWGISEQFRDA